MIEIRVKIILKREMRSDKINFIKGVEEGGGVRGIVVIYKVETYQDEVELRLESLLPSLPELPAVTRIGVLLMALELVMMLGVTRPGVSDEFVQMVELSGVCCLLPLAFNCMR